MRTSACLMVLWAASCTPARSTNCVTNPSVCAPSETCNAQTATCQPGSPGPFWSADASSGALATSDLNGVWGSSAQDVWAVGLGGVLLHYTGSAWAADAASGKITQFPLWNLWGSSAQDLWAFGDMGVILHYVGGAWTTDPMSRVLNSGDLRAVWANGKQNI